MNSSIYYVDVYIYRRAIKMPVITRIVMEKKFTQNFYDRRIHAQQQRQKLKMNPLGLISKKSYRPKQELQMFNYPNMNLDVTVH